MNAILWREKIQKIAPFLFLVLLGGILFFFRLGRFAFIDYDEATYALVSAEMVESGNYLSFTHNGSAWIDKPPLLFWLIDASVRLFGFSEWSLRLPGAVIGLGAVFLTYAFARALSIKKSIAFLSALILLTTGQFIYSARQVRMDIPVTFAILLATYSFFRGWQKSAWHLGAGIGLAMAILFKSFFAIYIPIFFLAFSLAYREWRWLRQPILWLSIAGGLILAAPWHILQYRAYGDTFIQTYLGLNGLRRYTNPFLGRSNADPLYFFKYAISFLEPWFALFSIGSLWLILRKKIKNALANGMDRPLWATFLSIAIMVGLISFSTSKFFYYFDPIYPFFAIFIALILMCWGREISLSPAKKRILVGLCLILGFASTFSQIMGREWPRGGGEYAIAQDEREIAFVLNDQKTIPKLYTLFHPQWDTIRFYTRHRAAPIPIEAFGQNTPTEGEFFLIVPKSVIRSIDSHPVIKRSEILFEGKKLTLFHVRAT